MVLSDIAVYQLPSMRVYVHDDVERHHQVA